MLRAVKFNYDIGLRTVKINYIVSDNFLTVYGYRKLLKKFIP